MFAEGVVKKRAGNEEDQTDTAGTGVFAPLWVFVLPRKQNECKLASRERVRCSTSENASMLIQTSAPSSQCYERKRTLLASEKVPHSTHHHWPSLLLIWCGGNFLALA